MSEAMHYALCITFIFYTLEILPRRLTIIQSSGIVNLVCLRGNTAKEILLILHELYIFWHLLS